MNYPRIYERVYCQPLCVIRSRFLAVHMALCPRVANQISQTIGEHLEASRSIGDLTRLRGCMPKIPTQNTVAARPEFIRLPPRQGLCPWTNLSRTKMCELLETGKIKNVRLRREGAIKGARLISLSSLLEYLHSQAQ